MNKLIALATLLAAVPALAANVSVDAAHDRHPISPQIYGLIGGADEQLARMGVTVRRHGGNQLSRYNWKVSTTNTGGDGFYYQKTPTRSADDFITQTKGAGAQTMIEIPIIGFVSTDLETGPQHCGFAMQKYGPQTSMDPTDPSCGNGVALDGGSIVSDPLDDSLAADEGFAGDWVTHLVTTFGMAQSGGVAMYQLGNQPALWNQTHRDIHPQPASYSEITGKLESFGKTVKSADPTALTLGPAAWGWLEYFDSAAQDRAKTGVDFIPFYLQAAKADEAKYGHRLLDYLDIHVYPQADRVAAGSTTEADNAMRLRSTRILWDPSYQVESWESCCFGNGVLQILPRMHTWIDQNYPGTRLAVTGYDFGAIDQPNGALTEALVLALFGQQGVDLAALETPPTPSSVGEDAFKLFRNYDGQGHQFAETSIRATSDAPTQLYSFASFGTNNNVTVVLINTDPAQQASTTLSFADTGDSGPFRVFGFGNGARLQQLSSGNVQGAVMTTEVPPASAVLVEFVPAGGVGPAGVDTDGGMGADGGAGGGGGASVGPNQGCACNFADAGVWLVGMIPVWLFRRRNRSQSGNVK